MFNIKELLEKDKLNSVPVLRFKSETLNMDTVHYQDFLKQKNSNYLKSYANFLFLQVTVDQISMSNYLNLIESVFVTFVESNAFLNLMSYKDPDMVDKLLIELEEQVLNTGIISDYVKTLGSKSTDEQEHLLSLSGITQESINYYKLTKHGILNPDYSRELFKSKISQIFNYLRTLKLSSYYKNSYIIKNFIPLIKYLMTSMDSDSGNVQRFNYNPNRLEVTDSNHLRVITRSYKDYVETGARPVPSRSFSQEDVENSFNVLPTRPLEKLPVSFEKFKLVKRNDTEQSISVFVKYSYLSNMSVNDDLKVFFKSILDKGRATETDVLIQNPFNGQQMALNQSVGLHFDIDKECFYFMSKKQSKLMNKKISLDTFDGYNLPKIIRTFKSKISKIRRKIEYKVYESDSYFDLKLQIYLYERKLKSVVNSVFNQISTLLGVSIDLKFSTSELFLKSDCLNLLKMRGYSLDLSKVSQGHINFNNKLHKFVRKVFSHFTKHYFKLKKMSKLFESESLASDLKLNRFTMYKNPPKNYTWDRDKRKFVFFKEDYKVIKEELEVCTIKDNETSTPKTIGLPPKISLVQA